MVWTLPGVTVGIESRAFRHELRMAPGTSHIVSFNLSRPRPQVRACYIGTSRTTAYRTIGAVSYLPAGIGLHAVGEPSDGTLLMCRFDASRFAQALDAPSEPEVDRLATCVDIREPDIVRTLQRLAEECRRPGLASAQLVENLVGTLAVDLARKMNAECAPQADDRDLGHVEAYLISRLHERPELAEVSRTFGTTPRRFGAELQARAGRSFSEFIAELRIRVARQLLETTSMPIKEICFRSGFRHVSSFTTAFRNATGETPRLYRNRFVKLVGC